jgi:hypothetical protein
MLAGQAAGVHQVLIVPQKQGALRHLLDVEKKGRLGGIRALRGERGKGDGEVAEGRN